MTPIAVAKYIIDRYRPTGTVLDPCRGKGAFFNNFPTDCEADWCELDEERDFFNYEGKADWIISNPPYSIFRQWLEHSFKVADNIVYLIPIAKIVGSKSIIKSILGYGGIVEIDVNWSGREIGFPFGFPCGAVYLKRGYDGPSTMDFSSFKAQLAK